jgi:hypothetical protein
VPIEQPACALNDLLLYLGTVPSGIRHETSWFHVPKYCASHLLSSSKI